MRNDIDSVHSFALGQMVLQAPRGKYKHGEGDDSPKSVLALANLINPSALPRSAIPG